MFLLRRHVARGDRPNSAGKTASCGPVRGASVRRLQPSSHHGRSPVKSTTSTTCRATACCGIRGFRATPGQRSSTRSIGWKPTGDTSATIKNYACLLVRAAGSPIGILPLCVRTEKYRVGTVRVLTYPLDNWGTWYGPIGSNRAATMLAAMQHIRRRRARLGHDRAPLVRPAVERRRPQRPVDAGRRPAFRQATDIRPRRSSTCRPLGRVPGRQIAQSTPRDSAVSLRRVFEGHDVEYIRHRPAPARDGDGDPRWDLYAMCEQVALASWQAARTNGNTLTHDRVRDFLRDAHAAAARIGMVDVNLLIVDGRPAAFVYNYHFHGRLTGLKIGYDASLGHAGVGTALMLRSIEDSFERGDLSYDLGPGESRFQRVLRTHTETNYRLTYSPLASWRSQAVRIARWAKRHWAPDEALVGKAASA